MFQFVVAGRAPAFTHAHAGCSFADPIMVMDKLDILSFEDAIKATGHSACTLLLGNGFSIAQGGGQFTYTSLLEKSGLADDSAIRNRFSDSCDGRL